MNVIIDFRDCKVKKTAGSRRHLRSVAFDRRDLSEPNPLCRNRTWKYAICRTCPTNRVNTLRKFMWCNAMSIGPISIFENTRSNRPSECVDADFEEFVNFMRDAATQEFSCKESAYLVCTTRFRDNQRNKANATSSAIVTLDIDSGLLIGEVIQEIEQLQLRALVCSTASHREDCHKFRVYIPLAEPATYDDHRKAWFVLNKLVADSKADLSKIGCESMFYVPGIYPNSPLVFEDIAGEIYSVSELVEVFDGADKVSEEAQRLGKSLNQDDSRTEVRVSVKKAPPVKIESAISYRHLDLKTTKLVTDSALEKYHAPHDNYHHARYRLILSIASRARTLKLSISAHDIVELFNQVDVADGGYYQTSDYQRKIAEEAHKAISEVSNMHQGRNQYAK